MQPAAVADGEGSQQSIVGFQAGQQLPASSTQLQLHPRGRNPHHQLQLLLWGHTGSYRVTQGSYRVPQSPMGSYRVLWGPKGSVGSITATAHPPHQLELWLWGHTGSYRAIKGPQTPLRPRYLQLKDPRPLYGLVIPH